MASEDSGMGRITASVLIAVISAAVIAYLKIGQTELPVTQPEVKAPVIDDLRGTWKLIGMVDSAGSATYGGLPFEGVAEVTGDRFRIELTFRDNSFPHEALFSYLRIGNYAPAHRAADYTGLIGALALPAAAPSSLAVLHADRPLRLTGIYTFNPTRAPRELDLAFDQGQFPAAMAVPPCVRGIYSLDGDRLQTCLPAFTSIATSRPLRFPPGAGSTALVWHRLERPSP
jgi:hypothetical protein